MIKKTFNEIGLIQNSSSKETEGINKEITGLLEKIRILELTQRDCKNEHDKIKYQFEYEMNKINSELKSSEEKL